MPSFSRELGWVWNFLTPLFPGEVRFLEQCDSLLTGCSKDEDSPTG